MAAITSSQAGPWSDPATWSGGVVPGDGDTATIDHAVTVDANTTIGTSPSAGTAVININSNDSLTINPGVTLTVKGDVAIGAGASLVVGHSTNGGATLVFDGTSGTVKYKARGAGNGAIFRTRGTSSSRSSVSSAGAGTANASITHNEAAFPFIIDCQFTDFLRIGDSSVQSLQWRSNISGDIMQLADCTFDACGLVANALATAGSTVFSLDRVLFKNTVSTSCLSIGGPPAARTSGTRRVVNCTFDKNVVGIAVARDFTIEDSIFMGGYSGSTSATAVPASFERNIVRNPSIATTWDHLDCYILNDNTTGNVGFLTVLAQARNQLINGIIFEKTHKETGDLGTCIAPALNGATTVTCTIQNCIVLPNANAAAPSGNILTLNTPNASSCFISLDHNTFYAAIARGGVEISEVQACTAGMLTSFQSNIAWGPASGTGFKMMDVGTNVNEPDVVSAANADYNCGHNLGTGSNGKGYTQLEFSSGTPGDHDIDVDPGFVDTTRCLPLFATEYLGKSASAWADATGYIAGDMVLASTPGWHYGQPVLYRCITAHTSNAANSTNGKPGDGDNVASWRTNWEYASLYYLRLCTAEVTGDVDYDADATVVNLLMWIREGYAPTNSLLEDAGHDGVTIGAVEGVFGPPVTVSITGPGTIVKNVPRNYTYTPDGDADGIEVTPTTDGTGTFDPASATFSGSTPLVFEYTATDHADSPHTLGSTDDGGLTNGTKVVTVLEVAPPVDVAPILIAIGVI